MRVMGTDNSHALRRIKQRLMRRPAYSLSDALNNAQLEREATSEPSVLTIETSEDKFGEDCHIKGCACKR